MDDRLVLWCGSVRSTSLAERQVAAEAGEFAAISIFPSDVAAADRHPDGSLSIPESAAEVTVIDPFARWLPDRFWDPPDRFTEEDVAWLDFDADEFFGMATALGVDAITLIEPFGLEPSTDVAAEHFGACCDRAADHDIDVMLEFMATSGIGTLDEAWTIVDAADRPNGGLMFDTWHYFRSDPDDELLATIPGDEIFAVQLSDGHEDIDWPLSVDMLHHRLPPGHGDFPIADTVRVLDRIDGLRNVGPEIFSDDFDERSPEDAGRAAGRATRDVLEAAGALD